MRYKVNEIFRSLQGEGTRAGRPCVFVRLTGCPLRCTYCDTAYAFHEGRSQDTEQILAAVADLLAPLRRGPEAPFVELTGGEPLAHPGASELLQALRGLGVPVALETAGSHDLAPVPPEVIKIVDRKTPGSGEGERWLESNLQHLVPGQDELKFVLTGPEDYVWAREWCGERGIWDRLTVLFAPAWGTLDPAWLGERILADGLPVRLQLQLHKILWGPLRSGV
ncbi:MAG: radical SAM protein [Acidobacteria bacterium]|nr:radical SAM protein [Acidobacteriota bacterium]